MVKNLPATAGDARDAKDTALIPGSGRSPEKEMAPLSRIPAQNVPGTEEPSGLQSMGSRKSRT